MQRDFEQWLQVMIRQKEIEAQRGGQPAASNGFSQHPSREQPD